MKPKGNAINEDPQELQDPQWLSRRKLTPFGFLVMVYDRMDVGEIFEKEKKLVLEGFVFMLPVT